MRIDSFDTGNPKPVQIVPYSRRTNHRKLQSAVVRGPVIGHQRSRKNGIISMVNSLDLDLRRRIGRSGVIPGEFSKRSLFPNVVRIGNTFHHNFGARRKLQAREFPVQ